jgi:hypothetical protein
MPLSVPRRGEERSSHGKTEGPGEAGERNPMELEELYLNRNDSVISGIDIFIIDTAVIFGIHFAHPTCRQ